MKSIISVNHKFMEFSPAQLINIINNHSKYVEGFEISIDYKSNIYKYRVSDVYLIDKNGTAEIIRNINKSTLTLITCKHNTKKQIVVIAEMI